jgi:hypothetical protein
VSTARATKKTTAKKKPKHELANHEVVVLAAYLAGAQKVSADTEDIAIKANQIAPGRFSWRKYKDQINIDTVRKRLWDAAKRDKGAYLIGSERTGWRLTKAGFDFARRKIRSVAAARLGKQRKSKSEGVAQTRELKRMMSEEAFIKFAQGRQQEITRSEAERFFRIDDYVTGQARAAKIERFKIMVAGNKTLSQALDFLSGLVREN